MVRCFLYAEDFSGIEKSGEAIGQFLLKAIDEIGPKKCPKRLSDGREALATIMVTKQWKDRMKVGDQQARTTSSLIVETISDEHF